MSQCVGLNTGSNIVALRFCVNPGEGDDILYLAGKHGVTKGCRMIHVVLLDRGAGVRGWVTRVQHVLQAAILHGTLTLLIEDEPFGWRIGRRVPGLLSLIGYVDSNLSNGRQIRPLITVVPTDVIRRYRHAMLLLERAVFPIAIKAVRAHCKNRHLRGDVAASPLVGSSLLFV